jgi:hypothetical protein
MPSDGGVRNDHGSEDYINVHSGDDGSNNNVQNGNDDESNNNVQNGNDEEVLSNGAIGDEVHGAL